MLKWLVYIVISIVLVGVFVSLVPFPAKNDAETTGSGYSFSTSVPTTKPTIPVTSKPTIFPTTKPSPKPTPTQKPTPKITISVTPSVTKTPTPNITLPPTLPPQPTIKPNNPVISTSRKDQSTAQHKFYYSDEGYVRFNTYSGLSNEYSDMSETYRYDFVEEVIYPRIDDVQQDSYLAELVDEIKSEKSNQKDRAMVAIGLVQHIPYDHYKADTAVNTMDWNYPYTTLHTEKGVCADKSLLLVYLLKELGYDVVLFDFKEHMAVGVKCIGNGDFRDTGYAYIETTGTTIPTYVPKEFTGGFTIPEDFDIIYIPSGDGEIDFRQEYSDANVLKSFEGKQTLNSDDYRKYMEIVERYDLTLA